MIYLLFAVLFAAGAAAAFVIPAATVKKEEVVVLESRERLEHRDNEFTGISLRHAVKRTSGKGDVIITDAIPVHEPDGAKVKLCFDRKTGEPVSSPHLINPVNVCFVLMSAFCLVLYLRESGKFNLTAGQLPLLMVCVPAVLLFLWLLSDLIFVLNPGVVKVKGKYEGYMHSERLHRLTPYYSLWYGEYRQYARCTSAPLSLHTDVKERTLFFDTVRGTAKRKADVIRNICLAFLMVGALAAVYMLLF